MPVWSFDRRLRELVVAFRKVAAKVRRPYAITGAVGMAAHGFTRPTSDLDVFLLRDETLEWIRAAHSVGLATTCVSEGRHHLAWFTEHRDPAVRIDLMFPSASPFVDGVVHSPRRRVGGLFVNALPIDLIAAAKLVSASKRDARDLEAMLSRGLVDGEAIARVLETPSSGTEGGTLFDDLRAALRWIDVGDQEVGRGGLSDRDASEPSERPRRADKRVRRRTTR